VAAALVHSQPAQACGACIHAPQDESTQVTGHRMIFATSKTQTTLYDQIEYSGNPESFSWVLPIHGQVDVGLSADAMFAFLGSLTSVQVQPPPIQCPPPPDGCQYYGGAEDGAGAGAGGGGGGTTTQSVTVISQKVVGPYETVQLQANDPNALEDWLAQHGYAVKDDLKPVIAAYQQEGFGFLAMKLVPGQGVKAMRPVRVTSKGAAMTLPLRMVAGGTGVTTAVTLWIVAEGRYQTVEPDFPNLTFNPDALVFHYEDYSSNYEVLLQGLFEASNGLGWLTQSAAPFDEAGFVNNVKTVVQNEPMNVDWGDPANNVSPLDSATEDLDTLFAGLDPGSVWLTRMKAELSREAFKKDLEIEAEPTQSQVSRVFQAKYADGPVPKCPDYSWCTNNGQNGGQFTGVGQQKGPYVNGKGNCSVERGTGRDDGAAALLAAVGLAAAGVSMRRRRNRVAD
jgi:hypothetical protein